MPLDDGFIPKVIDREGKNIGLNRLVGEVGCENFYSVCHGAPISNALNQIPGMNSFATLHDGWMIGLESTKGVDMSLLENLGSMPPAILVNYGALYEKYRIAIELAGDINKNGKGK